MPSQAGRPPEAEAAPWLYLLNWMQCLVTFVAKDWIRYLFRHRIRFRSELLFLTQRIFISHTDSSAYTSEFPSEEGRAASARSVEPLSSLWVSALLCPLPIHCMQLGRRMALASGLWHSPLTFSSGLASAFLSFKERFLNPYLRAFFSLLLERGEGTETSMRGRSTDWLLPHRGSNPQPFG